MKKAIFAIAVIIVVAIVLIFSLKKSETEKLSDSLNISLPVEDNTIVVSEKGWFGEGTLYKIFEIGQKEAEVFLTDIADNKRWSYYPLPDVMLDIIEYHGIDLPDVSSGYWIFSFDESDYDSITGQPHSIDLMLLIYDYHTANLHYIEYTR